ncbi:synemin [Saccopteryx bilineata]|uniref:synemin n=1 Tax=Saccopteryx bilineata TaxID=59482 RepID=UPI00338E1EAB
MLSWRLHTGAEKAHLQELNARLHDYVCRAQELERENLLLEEELRGRRGRQGLEAEGQARRAEEARFLRQQLAELSWTTALAEGERDALRRELRELQLLAEEARAVRGRLDAELDAQRQELREALDARAALEALLGRLQAERRGLDAAHERDVRELRTRSAGLTLRYCARAPGPAAPTPHLREAHDRYTLLVADSWRETVQLYEDEVRELETALQRDQESRRQAEDESRLCAQEAEALQCQALELGQLRALLEDELLRMREAYELQAEERQRVIARLEEEKTALTLAMADRLRDYQELVRVKTGLSLEVETYRALLEGERNPEILISTKRIEHLPPEFRSTRHWHSGLLLRRENERNQFLKHKPPSGSFRRSWTQPESQTAARNVPRRYFLGSGYASRAATRRESAYEKTIDSQANFRTFSPTFGISRDTEAHVQTFPDRPRTEGTKSGVSRKSTPAGESDRACRDNVRTWSNERTVILGKKTEAQATREQERDRARTVLAPQEERMFDSKEKASEERNLRWEELTKLDKEARERESGQMRDKARGQEALRVKREKVRDVPIRLEVSRDSTAEGILKSVQSPLKKDTGGHLGGGADMRGARFKLDTRDATGSLKGDSMTETIAESIVSSVLKQFTQSPDMEVSADSFPDTKVTYVGRKELPGDGKTKTEIVVESKLTEEVDVTDAAGVDSLLGRGGKGTVEWKGRSAEQVIGEMVHLGLRGREGRAKVVNVEIVEEPLSYAGGGMADESSTSFRVEADESPTPFQVEEADDVSPGSKGLVVEERYEAAFSASQREQTRLPPETAARVEEVTEAGDWEGEQNYYFVSTPEEYSEPSVGHDKDGGSVYGQIHIEEESTIRYSWQDEIVPESRRRGRRNDALGEVLTPPGDLEPSPERDLGSPHWIEETASGEFHAETTVIEKEIKIPHEFHASMKKDFQEPRHQLVEVIGQLQESLPERVKEELSTALTSGDQGRPGHLSVDVKKVQTLGGGAVTLVAEVNLSETVDADRLDLEQLSRDEAGVIEKAVESVVRDGLARRHSPEAGSPDRDVGGAAPAASSGFGFKRWATQELYRSSGEDSATSWASHSSTERVTSPGPVAATVEVTSPTGFAQSHVLEDVNQSVRRIQIGPPGGVWRTEQVSHEGTTAGETDVSHREAAPSWTRETTVLFPAGMEAEAPRSAWRDVGPGNDQAAAVSHEGQEQAAFDKTVQLQRMVDQRSVVSDEKKVAVLFLDNQGEDDEGDWF